MSKIVQVSGNGGTSLRKLFFGDYRFSTDLDFTSAGSPKQEELEREIEAATIIVSRTDKQSVH